VVLGGGLFAMGLDWQLSLPPLVRALVLVGILTGAGVLAWRYLLAPLAERMDDLALALRVEEQYPVLNDALASTVQFLEQPGTAEEAGSPSLRREAVQRAMRLAQGVDFGKVIDRRGIVLLGIAAVLLLALAGHVFVWYSLAPTALARLLDPFGDHTWT